MRLDTGRRFYLAPSSAINNMRGETCGGERAMADSKNLVQFTDANFESEVLKSDAPVLVDFWAEWCGPCVRLGPTIAEIADELAGKAKIGKLNVDENPQVAMRYKVMSIPTVMVFKKGEIVRSLVGLQPKTQYLKALAEGA
jgi:thioredoxin 1